MTEQMMPTGKVEEIVGGMREAMRRVEDGVITDPQFMASMLVYVAALEALLPPPRKTMADMTPEERKECAWMQADVGNDNMRMILDQNGRLGEIPLEQITPRFDLPRLAQEDDQKAEDVPTVKVGIVIESADDPRISALPAWTVLQDPDGRKITKFNANTDDWRGPGYVPIAGDGTEYGPWTIARLPKEEVK